MPMESYHNYKPNYPVGGLFVGFRDEAIIAAYVSAECVGNERHHQQHRDWCRNNDALLQSTHFIQDVLSLSNIQLRITKPRSSN